VRAHTKGRAKPSAINMAPTSCPPTVRTPHRTPMIAAHRAFCAGATRTCNSLEVEFTVSHELPKPRCRPIAQLTFGGTARSISFGRVETNEPKGLATNPNRVAVQHLNMTPINRRGTRDRGGKMRKEAGYD